MKTPSTPITTSHARGHHAEKVAARYLQQQGYKVFALNWRCPRAEIDIVGMSPSGAVVFVEVKYRQTNSQGSGLEYITPAKLRQMQFAAQLWIAANNYHGEYTLGAIEVAGPGYAVTTFVESIC
jgi:Holliday junction resolvase-like predicted endonuclease